jgi:serine/threonine protein kinase
VGGIFPGTLITPAVQLVRPLRSGGMGSVWVAEHLALHTQVAVKFLSADLAQDPESVSRFKHEAAAASQVKSPHVVQTFDNGLTEDGLPFIVMELLEGEDLTHRLHSGPLPLPVVGQVVLQIGKALGRAHEKGIIHRDIKPDNIFLCETGEDEIFCKLLDFGVAKGGLSGATMSGHTGTGSMVGTPYYMSPEQAVSARDIDYRSDIWSLGMVAFEAMTGRRALDADSLGALVLALHTAPLPPPSEFVPTLHPDIDRWFSIACAKLPRDRFQSAREMADALMMIVGEGMGRRRGDSESSDGGRQLVTDRDRPTLTAMEGRALAQAQSSGGYGHESQPGVARRSGSPVAPAVQTPRLDEGLDEPFGSGRRVEAAPISQPRPSDPVPSAQVPSLQAPRAKVPSLVPPPVSPRRGKQDDDDWKQLIDRSNANNSNRAVATPTPVVPAARRSIAAFVVEPTPPRSKAGLVLVILGLTVLLMTGVVLYQRRGDALHVLFPGLSPSASGPASGPAKFDER